MLQLLYQNVTMSVLQPALYGGLLPLYLNVTISLLQPLYQNVTISLLYPLSQTITISLLQPALYGGLLPLYQNSDFFVGPTAAHHSGKMCVLDALLRGFAPAAPGERVVVMSNYTKVGLLVDEMAVYEMIYCRRNGRVFQVTEF